MRIRVGSRESKLAVIQSQMVMDAIRQAVPDAVLELVTMKTTGDRILDKTLDQIGGKGLFVKELDQALRDGRVDFTVHSLKDMPMEVPEDLPLAAFSRREDPGTCWYCRRAFPDWMHPSPSAVPPGGGSYSSRRYSPRWR